MAVATPGEETGTPSGAGQANESRWPGPMGVKPFLQRLKARTGPPKAAAPWHASASAQVQVGGGATGGMALPEKIGVGVELRIA